MTDRKEPTAAELGLTGNGDQPEPPEAESISGVLHSHYGPTPEDERERLNRSITVISTGVDGLAYVAAATAEHGVETKVLDFRDSLPDTRPTRTKGTRVVSDLPSFITEAKRKVLTDESTLWASQSHNTVVAVYNDHTDDRAGYRDDVLMLKLQADEEWVAWHQLSGKYLKQEEFGDAIEELLHTVVRPDQADLMEVIESVRVSTGSVFESGIRRMDGQQTISYKEESTTSAGRSQQLEVPQTITIGIKPFEGYDVRYECEAWFRLRVVGGVLHLSIKLKPTRNILIGAWRDLRNDMEEALEKPVLLAE